METKHDNIREDANKYLLIMLFVFYAIRTQ